MEQEIQPLKSITSPWVAIPIIVLVSGIVFFWALGEPAYWDRDEPRNAECAAQMMARGDWIVPTFNDELRQQKPPLLYWLMGVAYSVFGVNDSVLIFCVTMALWFFSRSFAKDRCNPFTVPASFIGIYLFLGLAMLAKGPVGFLLPMAVMGWVLLQRDWIESDLTSSDSGFLRRIAEPFAPARFLPYRGRVVVADCGPVVRRRWRGD